MQSSSLDHVASLLLQRLTAGYSAYEDMEWIHKLCAYVKQVYEEYPSKKIIGICFGHQIVAQALGGKVEVNQKGWEIAVRQIALADGSEKIFRLENSFLVYSFWVFFLHLATATDA
jgi:GMP synthase-like glutamine amidotransferase